MMYGVRDCSGYPAAAAFGKGNRVGVRGLAARSRSVKPDPKGRVGEGVMSEGKPLEGHARRESGSGELICFGGIVCAKKYR